jgi:hypothetical protein
VRPEPDQGGQAAQMVQQSGLVGSDCRQLGPYSGLRAQADDLQVGRQQRGGCQHEQGDEPAAGGDRGQGEAAAEQHGGPRGQVVGEPVGQLTDLAVDGLDQCHVVQVGAGRGRVRAAPSR